MIQVGKAFFECHPRVGRIMCQRSEKRHSHVKKAGGTNTLLGRAAKQVRIGWFARCHLNAERKDVLIYLICLYINVSGRPMHHRIMLAIKAFLIFFLRRLYSFHFIQYVDSASVITSQKVLAIPFQGFLDRYKLQNPIFSIWSSKVSIPTLRLKHD